MERILAKELKLEKQLQNLQLRKSSLLKNTTLKLSEIATPDDIGVLSEARKATAIERNANLLRDLEMELGKLHTKQLCPIEPRLKELKKKYMESQETDSAEDIITSSINYKK